ncbi:hypothetical protein GCM10029992_17430 [Glycomyces albus]
MHAGSLGLALEPGGRMVEAWLEGLGAATTISLDPNVRQELLGDRERYRARLDRWLSLADLVKVSNEDLDWIWPGGDAAELARSWVAQGRRLVVVTHGGDGSQVFGSGYEFTVAAHRADIVDTVGAGDSFSGGLLHWLDRADRLRPEALARLTAREAREAVEFASAVAAATCSRAGANPPRRDELSA